MYIVKELISNKVLVCAAVSWFIAQFSKNVLETIKYGFSVKRLTGSGAMPSTHTSVVVSLATGAFMVDGPGSTVFALAVFVAFIVVYDAMGVRRTTGQQSKVLNRILAKEQESASVLSVQPEENMLFPSVHPEENTSVPSVHLEENTSVPYVHLEENMGHNLTECIVGGAIGLITTILLGQLM